jgi:tRNA threonylcarbamoyl adenosine modification protein YjeE
MAGEYEVTSFDQLESFCEELYREQKKEKVKIFLLSGDVGAGKTTFTSMFIKKNLCSDGEDFESLQVMSPTFSIMNIYQIKSLSVAHLDLYRISEESIEIEEILEVIEESDYSFIEWPSKVESLENFIGKDFLRLNFRILEDQKRCVEVS